MIHTFMLLSILSPLIAWPICCLWDAYRNARREWKEAWKEAHTDKLMRRGMRYGVKRGLIRRDVK